jgi:predicted acyltransferase
VPGVLQRIGLCYLATAFAYRWVRGSGPAAGTATVVARLAALAALTLVGYWLALLIVPGATGSRFDLAAESNIGAVIDRAVFGTHTWQKTWDPEGLFSTVPSIGTTLLGAVAGVWLHAAAGDPRRLVKGLAYGGLGVALVGAVWSLQFPMIKNVWTSSYAMFSAGLAALSLAACYWLVDVRGWRSLAHPFVVLGTNAITLFVVSGLVGRLLLVIKVTGPAGKSAPLKTWVYRSIFEPLLVPVQASLLFAVVNLIALYALLWWMYRRNVFIKV